mmetsp:Transcript_96830/g.283060  ORF Transcript_96830/g.283060 Transcript_96830/m.283060 type:complete len:408 (+) Transcript_96830:71-1294(+)
MSLPGMAASCGQCDNARSWVDGSGAIRIGPTRAARRRERVRCCAVRHAQLSALRILRVLADGADKEGSLRAVSDPGEDRLAPSAATPTATATATSTALSSAPSKSQLRPDAPVFRPSPAAAAQAASATSSATCSTSATPAAAPGPWATGYVAFSPAPRPAPAPRPTPLLTPTATPQELRACLLHFMCNSPAFGPLPVSAGGLNADIKRAYFKAGHAPATLAVFRAADTAAALRTIHRDLQSMQCVHALVLDDAGGKDDLFILAVDVHGLTAYLEEMGRGKGGDKGKGKSKGKGKGKGKTKGKGKGKDRDWDDRDDHELVRTIPVKLNGLHPEEKKGRLLGSGGEHFKYIRSRTKAEVWLEGSGSGHGDSREPLCVWVRAESRSKLDHAVELVEDLLAMVAKESRRHR